MNSHHDMPSPQLERDAFGALRLAGSAGEPEAVTPVRAFPLSAPGEGVSLVGADGRERFWIERMDALPPATRALIEEALAPRDFAPVLLRLESVSSFGVPSTWQVRTDRGDTTLILEGEEDIRRLPGLPGGNALLITDSQGIVFLVPDSKALDRPSRKLLERFL